MSDVDDGLTPKKRLTKKDKQRLFLAAFAEQANVLLSARAAGVSRQMVYQWQEHDEDFSFAFHQAKEDAKDVLRAEIYRRGKEGWDEPLYQQGIYCGTIRKYSDTLLIFHAKMLMPEYRDRQQDININNVNVQVERNELYAKLREDELDQLEAMWSRTQERLNRGD